MHGLHAEKGCMTCLGLLRVCDTAKGMPIWQCPLFLNLHIPCLDTYPDKGPTYQPFLGSLGPAFMLACNDGHDT